MYIMTLLPAYYTTNGYANNTRIKKKKSNKQLQAEKAHKEFIDIYTSGGHRIKANTSAFQAGNESSSLSARSIPPCSDVIPTWTPKKKAYTNHNFTIAPAYNKGSYQVISRKDVKDIGR